jgi:hypothetical protein
VGEFAGGENERSLLPPWAIFSLIHVVVGRLGAADDDPCLELRDQVHLCSAVEAQGFLVDHGRDILDGSLRELSAGDEECGDLVEDVGARPQFRCGISASVERCALRTKIAENRRRRIKIGEVPIWQQRAAKLPYRGP